MLDRVHVIDDDEGLRAALAFLLDVHGFEASFYDSAAAFLDVADQAKGCILTDVRMPGLSGLELVHELRARGIQTPVVIMTAHGDIPLAVEAMRAGVSDVLEKPFDDDRLLEALRVSLRRTTDGEAAEARGRLERLSKREREVLAGVVDGRMNKQIAHDLGISARTVEIYRAHLMTKIGAKNVAELMRIALAAGL